MKKGYKGTDENMSCRGAKYEFNTEYRKPEKENPRCCTADGFHYCNKLVDVFSRKSNNGKNRFFEIEVLGNFTDSNSESITTAFRFIRELSKEEIVKAIIEDNLMLSTVKKLQINNPYSIVAGSVSLYLQGIKLKRFSEHKASDIDVILPFFSLFEGSQTESNFERTKPSGNDFDCVVTVDGCKIDIIIDPKEPYSIVNHDGFKYKVARIEETLKAKLNYSAKGDEKHKNDIMEMIGIKK